MGLSRQRRDLDASRNLLSADAAQDKVEQSPPKKGLKGNT